MMADLDGGEMLLLMARRLDDIVEQAILRAMDRYGGNMTLAAQELGITRYTVSRRLKLRQQRRQVQCKAGFIPPS